MENERQCFLIGRYVDDVMSRDFTPIVFEDEEEAREHRNHLNRIKDFGIFKILKCNVWWSAFPKFNPYPLQAKYIQVKCCHLYETDTEYQLMSNPPQFKQTCKKCGKVNFIFCSDYEILNVSED